MRNFVSTSTKGEFDDFRVAIGSRRSATLRYLHRAHLPCEKIWAHHSVKWFFNFGILTTNMSKVEKHGLPMRSTLFIVLFRIMRLMEWSDEARRRRIAKEFFGRYV